VCIISRTDAAGVLNTSQSSGSLENTSGAGLAPRPNPCSSVFSRGQIRGQSTFPVLWLRRSRPEYSAFSPLDLSSTRMETHHTTSIQNLVAHLQADPAIVALLLGGSLAHGFARPDSDIDVAIVQTPEAFARQRTSGRLHYNNRELCTYPGYIDGKYMDEAFLRAVAARGSDPARFAFQDARILFSRLPGLESLLAAIVRYPIEQQAERVARFSAQLLGWRWYFSEALRQQNPYLGLLARQKLVLFSARIVLAVNATFFPYHKWMLRVLASVPRQPPGLAAALDDLVLKPDLSFDEVDHHCRDLLTFAGLDHDTANASWPSYFMRDTELRWLEEEPAIDDL